MANPEPQSFIPRWTLGDRLAKALDHSNVTVAEMAEHVGVSRNTIGNYTSDRTTPRRAVIAMWALRTGVPIEWIETGAEPGAQDNPPSPAGGVTTGKSGCACNRSPQATIVPLRRLAA